MPKLADLFATVPAQAVAVSPMLAKLRHDYPALCFSTPTQCAMRHDRALSGICSRCHTKTPAPTLASTGAIAQQGR